MTTDPTRPDPEPDLFDRLTRWCRARGGLPAVDPTRPDSETVTVALPPAC